MLSSLAVYTAAKRKKKAALQRRIKPYPVQEQLEHRPPRPPEPRHLTICLVGGPGVVFVCHAGRPCTVCAPSSSSSEVLLPTSARLLSRFAVAAFDRLSVCRSQSLTLPLSVSLSTLVFFFFFFSDVQKNSLKKKKNQKIDAQTNL